MSIHLKRHKALQLFKEFGLDESNIDGILYNEFVDKFGYNKFDTALIFSELIQNNEIEFNKVGVKNYLRLKNEGIASLSNDKYNKLYKSDRKQRIIYISQVSIPVVALLLSGLIFLFGRLDHKEHTEEIELLWHRIELLNDKLDNI